MSSLKRAIGAASAALALFSALPTHGQDAEREIFHVAERWPVGGTGGWDYLTLDKAGARLFVTRQDRVDVIDTTSGNVVGSIAKTSGAHGVALAPGLKRGYVSNGSAASVTAFNLDTLRTVMTAKVSGTNPDAIVFEPVGQHIFTFNGASSNASVLDAQTLAPVASIALPGKPEFAVADGTGRVFVNIQSEPGQMAVIDANTLTLRATRPLPGCALPTGLALDQAHHRLFSVCTGNVMLVTNAASGRVIASLAIGEHPDAAAFDPGLALVFSANGDGTLTVIHEDDPDHYHVVQTLATQKSARTLALDPALHRIYLVAADFGAAPAASPTEPHPRAPVLPNTFTILVAAPR